MRAVILSLLSAALLTIAWPDYGFAPVLLIAFVPLLWMTDAFGLHRWKKVLLIALTFTVWNLLTCWWIANAHWIGAVAAVLLNTLLMTLVFIIYLWSKKHLSKFNTFLLLTSLWVSMEFLMYRWDLLWPWMTLGNGFANFPNWIQWYEYTGVLGGSTWILLFNIGTYKVFRIFLNKDSAFYRSLIKLIVLCFVLPLVLSYSLIPSEDEFEESIEVVIVQPNVDPYTEKFNGSPEKQMQHFFTLAREKMDADVDLVIGPETVYPSGIWEHQISAEAIPGLVNFKQDFSSTSLLFGLTTFRLYASEKEASPTARKLSGNKMYDAYNASMWIDVQNKVGISQKGKLVPGAEMMPFANLLTPLKKLMLDFGGTSGSLGMPDSIRVFGNDGGFHVASAICYESVCGEYVGEMVLKGADIIAVITNDGWWGNTQGYKQHRAYARLRAIEHRRSVVRSANTGISCVIDPSGSISDELLWDETGAIRSGVKLNDHITFYTKYGDYPGRLAGFLAVILLLFALVKSRSKEMLTE